MAARTCQGCGEPATDFQCPLCQAEDQQQLGFFCSQECFAKNWLEHRNTYHKSGVVREKRRDSAVVSSSTKKGDEGERARASERGRKGKDRPSGVAARRGNEEAEEEEEEEEEEEGTEYSPLMYLPWPPMPSPAFLASRKKRAAMTTPPLDPHCARAVVGAAPGDTPLESLWPQVVAAAHCVAEALGVTRKNNATNGGGGGGGISQVLVVAGDARSAHAFAWAARCAGLAGSLRLLVHAGQAAEAIAATVTADAAALKGATASPSQLFSSQRPVIVTTCNVVRAVGGADASGGSGAAALWLTEGPASLLVTLPDVAEAGDLQGLQTRGIFFVARSADEGTQRSKKGGKTAHKEEEEEAVQEAPAAGGFGAAAAWAVEEAITHTAISAAELEALLPQPSLFPLYELSLSWQPMPSLDSVLADELSSEEEEDDDDDDDDAKGKGNSRGTAKGLAENGEGADDEELLTVSRQQCISNNLDNDLATCLANGDGVGALQHWIRVYSSSPGYFEEVFYNAFCCDWGAASVAHMHHRLAQVTRRLVDASGRFAAKKGATLADAVLRAATRLVRLLPPMLPTEDAEDSASGCGAVTEEATVATAQRHQQRKPSEKEKRDYFNYYNRTVPNLQLQATICYLFPVAPAATLDAFAAAWSAPVYLEGPKALQAANAARRRMVERIESRYAAKLDKPYASFLVILAQLLYDAVAVYSLSVPDLEARLLWSLTVAAEVGSLPAFLANCFLLREGGEERTGGGATTNGKKRRLSSLSGRNTGKGAATAAASSSGQQHIEQLRLHEVKAASPSDYIRLPWKAFPLSGQREREVARLHKMAVEEVLMAMPRVPKPMYIGDVGNLLGKWFAFNARFGGVLGVSLSDFLSKHPEEFQLVGRLVTRRKAGKSEQVRVRFDQENYNADDESDDEEGGASRNRKSRDRELLTGKSNSRRKAAAALREQDLPARARKKRARKAFNKERFNRNYKQSDPSARVPGFVKGASRRITGRGKKPNKRTVKRG